jgi:hypothetical protein
MAMNSADLESLDEEILQQGNMAAQAHFICGVSAMT